MSRFHWLRAAASAAAFIALVQSPAAMAEPLSFDQALSLATQRSEAAHASRAAASGASESARAARQLPDPMLIAGVDNLPVTGADRFSTTRESMTMKRIGISQEWLSADKRAAREAASHAAAEREAAQATAAEADARLQAALAYVDAWYAGQALDLASQTEHHLHEEVEAARARLATATGTSAELLQLAAAQGLAEDDSSEVRQQQASAWLVLQRWTGVLPDALAGEPAFNTPTEQDFANRHPDVVMRDREVEVARLEAEATARQRTPNWTWELSYAQRSGYSDMVSLGVTIPLQVAPSQRQDRETAAKRAALEQARAAWAEATRAAQADYRMAMNEANRLQQRIERYRLSVMQPARQRAVVALAAYRSNQSTLSALFEARHAEVEVQRKLISLQRELARAQARLAFTPIATDTVRQGAAR